MSESAEELKASEHVHLHDAIHVMPPAPQPLWPRDPVCQKDGSECDTVAHCHPLPRRRRTRSARPAACGNLCSQARTYKAAAEVRKLGST